MSLSPKRCDSGVVLRRSLEKGEQNVWSSWELARHVGSGGGVIGFLLVSAFLPTHCPVLTFIFSISRQSNSVFRR